METSIQKTLVHWFPKAFGDMNPEVFHSDYEILSHFARYTLMLIGTGDDRRREPFKLILQLYLKGSLYEKNAIENEYLRVLAEEEKTLTLVEHLGLMPGELRTVYLKTILENQLTTS